MPVHFSLLKSGSLADSVPAEGATAFSVMLACAHRVFWRASGWRSAASPGWILHGVGF